MANKKERMLGRYTEAVVKLRQRPTASQSRRVARVGILASKAGCTAAELGAAAARAVSIVKAAHVAGGSGFGKRRGKR